ncbi:MAG: tyrosine/serine/threonine protein phosphatase pps1 [Chrysothrix sp. TS-e1954]|nr:MAG: tyrosine/serine/threonine protein phosphatase pps1 [Chrysothrix sp. TS-e1954]
MATLVAQASEVPSRPQTPPHHLTLNTSLHGNPPPVPNKYIPFCSPGPIPTFGLPSPPESPQSRRSSKATYRVFYPPDSHSKINDTPPVYEISAATLAFALDHASRQPLPEPDKVFPWLHGLHADNQMQLSFFAARRRTSRKVPKCLQGLTVVKAGGDLSKSRLKGAVAPEDVLAPLEGQDGGLGFHDVDPKCGFSVRNFQIQACKMATVSDIVVYGDDSTTRDQTIELSRHIANAQRQWRDATDPMGVETEEFNTFVVLDDFSAFQENFPETVSTDQSGSLTGNIVDLLWQERLEMHSLAKASEIATNVWLGPTSVDDENHFDILVDANDLATLPEAQDMSNVEEYLDANLEGKCVAQMEFPSSGSIDPTSSVNGEGLESDRFLGFCHWLHAMANPAARQVLSDVVTADNPSCATSSSKPPRRILIHCTDGYTESSLLALAYLMFADSIPLHEAWVRLHREKGRNFFAYPTDKGYLQNLEARILRESPRPRIDCSALNRPLWLSRMDGSIPSRIMPYLYLGNLNHADNPALLKELGITQVLSVGEPIRWPSELLSAWGEDRFLFVDQVQDNGVDPLTNDFDRCLKFIGKQTGSSN